jgi:hypothetical protein
VVCSCGSYVGGEGHGAIYLSGSFAGGGLHGAAVSSCGLLVHGEIPGSLSL